MQPQLEFKQCVLVRAQEAPSAFGMYTVARVPATGKYSARLQKPLLQGRHDPIVLSDSCGNINAAKAKCNADFKLRVAADAKNVRKAANEVRRASESAPEIPARRYRMWLREIEHSGDLDREIGFLEKAGAFDVRIEQSDSEDPESVLVSFSRPANLAQKDFEVAYELACQS